VRIRRSRAYPDKRGREASAISSGGGCYQEGNETAVELEPQACSSLVQKQEPDGNTPDSVQGVRWKCE
jgi:hypothetical protein